MKVFLFMTLVSLGYAALLGSNECTYGPSYWCSSLSKAAKCQAVDHCVRTWKAEQNLDAVDDNPACQFCMNIIGDIKSFIDSNQTLATIEEFVKRGCGFMPDDFSKNECKNVADHYINELITCVDHNVDPQKICSLMWLCGNSTSHKSAAVASKPSQVHRLPLKLANTRENTQCDTCKAFMELMKKELNDPANQAKLVSLGQAECEKLDKSIVAECKTMVKEYLPDVISFADSNLGGTVCFLLGMCASEQRAVDYKALALAAMKQSGLMAGIKRLSHKLQASSDKYCDTCEEIFGYIKIIMNNNATLDELKSLLENDLCTQLGAEAGLCKVMVDQYLPQAYAELLKLLDPATICTELHLCNGTASMQKLPAPVKLRVKVTAGPECVLCEYLMDKLMGILTEEKTEESIEKSLEKVCDLLAVSLRPDCDKYIEQYGPQIIKLLVSELKPELVCTFLGVCSSSVEAKLGDECAVCEMVVNYLESMLKNNKTEEEIIAELEKLCGYLPDSMATECDNLIDTYGKQIITLLIQQVDPKTVCTELQLCSALRHLRVDGRVHLYNSNN